LVVNYVAFWVSSNVVVRNSSGGEFANGAPADALGRRTTQQGEAAVATDAPGRPKPARVKDALGVPNATNVAVVAVSLVSLPVSLVDASFSLNAVLFAVSLAGCGHALLHVALALQVILPMAWILLVFLQVAEMILRRVLLEVALPLAFLRVAWPPPTIIQEMRL
jgi:hypothetical protein